MIVNLRDELYRPCHSIEKLTAQFLEEGISADGFWKTCIFIGASATENANLKMTCQIWIAQPTIIDKQHPILGVNEGDFRLTTSDMG
jgi:hypothetical protein